jgi:uncharacterized protein (TIGR02646 family)
LRTIRKLTAPNLLTQWRLPRLAEQRSAGMECTYAELRRDPTVLAAVEDGLFREQGGLCAYTGQRIGLRTDATRQREVDFHIEHLTPQAFCAYGQDTEYTNLVACWPRPNCGFEPAYGARKKGAWPAPQEQELFVSPLRPDCSARFSFSQRGEISPTRSDDNPANETIQRLGLNHPTLVELRRAAIRGALYPANRPVGLADARRLLRRMRQDAEDVDRGIALQLMPFCFAVQPVLERTILQLESRQPGSG